MGLPLAVDYDRKSFEEISSSDLSVISGGVFKLAKSQPENFLDQLSWDLSDDPEDLFSGEFAQGPAACFHSRIWMESWLKTLGSCKRKSIQFATGKMGGRVIVAIPLTVIPGQFVTCVEFAGQHVSDYNTPLVHHDLAPYLSQTMISAMMQQIAKLFPDADCVDFRKLLLSSPPVSKDGVRWSEDAELTHICVLTGNWEHDLSQFIGKSTRKSLRKKFRKLETFGAVEFEEITVQDRRHYAGEKLIEWKARQLKDLGAASVYENTAFCDFLRATIHDDRSGMVRMFSMNIDAEPIAVVYALCLEGHWFLYQMSYTSEEPGKYSPGYHLLLHVMEMACRQKVETFDFGWGNETYKHRFATESKPLYNAFCPLTKKGRLALRLCNSKIGIKNFVKSSQHLQAIAKFGLRTFGKLQVNLASRI